MYQEGVVRGPGLGGGEAWLGKNSSRTGPQGTQHSLLRKHPGGLRSTRGAGSPFLGLKGARAVRAGVGRGRGRRQGQPAKPDSP